MSSTHDILTERARTLSQRPIDEASTRAQFVLVRRTGLLIGLRVAEVESAGRVRDITPVPGAPEWLRGAAVHRAHVVSLIDLAGLWGEAGGGADLPSFVCLRLRERRLGLLVEELLGFDETDATLETWQGSERAGVVAVTHRGRERVLVISAERLFSSPELT